MRTSYLRQLGPGRIERAASIFDLMKLRLLVTIVIVIIVTITLVCSNRYHELKVEYS